MGGWVEPFNISASVSLTHNEMIIRRGGGWIGSGTAQATSDRRNGVDK